MNVFMHQRGMGCCIRPVSTGGEYRNISQSGWGQESTLMRRLLVMFAIGLFAFTLGTPAAWAGSPHFVDSTVTASRSGNTLTVTGKEAGLGDEAQVHIVVTATAECINGGSNHPKASNKESVSTEGTFPVQNGKADFSLSVTATFQPSCSPPMSVIFVNIVVTDTTNNISQRLGNA